MKKLPIGLDDFKTLIIEDYYYIDKTKFIEEVINDGAIVNLFCRPRRFGKTLNMSMLRYFFDIQNKEENRKLFTGLKIENSPVMIEQGKYPVIFISMKEIKGESFEKCIEEFRNILFNLFNEFSYIRDNLNEGEKRVFDEVWQGKGNVVQIRFALKNLCDFLKKYYNQPVVILIDEYDVPLTSAYEYGYYNEAVNFFKAMYGSILKTNVNLKLSVMTGAIRIAQAGIFSDLNNISVHTILDNEYDESFGLTEPEVIKALQDYNVEYDLETVKAWYDGYRFGNSEIYNPWSIVNYLSKKKIGAYWINTSGNLLIKSLLENADKDVFDTLENLFQQKEAFVYINQSIALGTNLSGNQIWELFLFSGYLTIVEKADDDDRIYQVRIPNKEIMSFFKGLFIDIVFKGNVNTVAEMKMALKTKNIPVIKKMYRETCP